MVEFNPYPIQYRSDIYLGAPYKKEHTPHLLLDPSFKPLEDRINCQMFVQLYYRLEFGVELPVGMWSQELFNDSIFFRSVDEGERLVRGDICFFGSKEADPKDLHVAVVHRANLEFEEIILRHANQRDNEVSDWTMREALGYVRYPVLHGVRRLIPDIFITTVAPVIVFE